MDEKVRDESKCELEGNYGLCKIHPTCELIQVLIKEQKQKINDLEIEVQKFKENFDYWICSWCGEKFKKSEGVDKPALHMVECKQNPLLSLLSGKEKEFEELKDAINNAQRDNPDEVHCTCVPLLKARIKVFEKEKDDLSGICAAAIRRRIELEEGIKLALRFGTFHQVNEELEAKKKLQNLIKEEKDDRG